MGKKNPEKFIKMLNDVIQGNTASMQAAWIEWQHGRGAEAAMVWIHNTLAGPGLVPDEDDEYGREAQAWYSRHKPDPFPDCICGRPSSKMWMGQGFCSDEHYQVARDLYEQRQAREEER